MGSGVVRLSFDLVVPGGLVALLPVLPAWVLPLPDVPDADLPEPPEVPIPELEPLMPDVAALPAVGAGVVELSFDLVVPAGLVASLPDWAPPDIPAPEVPEPLMPELEPLVPVPEPLMPELDPEAPVPDGVVMT